MGVITIFMAYIVMRNEQFFLFFRSLSGLNIPVNSYLLLRS